MGLVKEPKGVDFLIKSKPLSQKERIEITKFIKESKEKNNLELSITLSKRIKKATI